MLNNHSTLHALKYQFNDESKPNELSDFGTRNPRISDFPEREAGIFKSLYDMCDKGIEVLPDYMLLSFPFIEDFNALDIQIKNDPLTDLQLLEKLS